MSRIVVALMVRNEAHRYLPSMLSAWSDFADTIVALDDISEDATPELLQSNPKVQYHERHIKDCRFVAWGKEKVARAELWLRATKAAEPGDWIFVLDADMVPAMNPRDLMLDCPGDALAFRLYDLWNLDPLEYRSDHLWKAHHSPRVWAVRKPGDDFSPEWPDRGIHTGHFPSNLSFERVITVPQEFSLLHYGYATPEDREWKWLNYTRVAKQLDPLEFAHAGSINDKDPHTLPLPLDPEWPVQRETDIVNSTGKFV